MSPGVVLVVVIFVMLASGLAVVALRRPPVALPPEVMPEVEEDSGVRRSRQQALDRRGAELLDRRVQLDMRRGTLGGNTEVYEAFEELEKQLRSGAIDEEQFEAEKLKLLSGG